MSERYPKFGEQHCERLQNLGNSLGKAQQTFIISLNVNIILASCDIVLIYRFRFTISRLRSALMAGQKFMKRQFVDKMYYVLSSI